MLYYFLREKGWGPRSVVIYTMCVPYYCIFQQTRNTHSYNNITHPISPCLTRQRTQNMSSGSISFFARQLFPSYPPSPLRHRCIAERLWIASVSAWLFISYVTPSNSNSVNFNPKSRIVKLWCVRDSGRTSTFAPLATSFTFNLIYL